MQRLHQPYPDESLSSWLQRVSFYKSSSAYRDFVYSNVETCDLDYGLNNEQVEQVASNLLIPSDLVKRIVTPPSSWVISDVSNRRMYCPKCWLDDVRAGRTPYWRKSWSNVWTIYCYHHAMFLEDGERIVHSFVPDAALFLDKVLGSPSIQFNLNNDKEIPVWKRRIRTSDVVKFQRSIEHLQRFGHVNLFNLKVSIESHEFLSMLSDLISLVARFHPRNSYQYGMLVRNCKGLIYVREFAINCPENIERLALLNTTFDLMDSTTRRCGLVELGRLCGMLPIRDPYSIKPMEGRREVVSVYWRYACTGSSIDLEAFFYCNKKYTLSQYVFQPEEVDPEYIPYIEWLDVKRKQWAKPLRELFDFPLM